MTAEEEEHGANEREGEREKEKEREKEREKELEYAGDRESLRVPSVFVW